MNGTITLTDDQWAELKAQAMAACDLWNMKRGDCPVWEWTRDELMEQATAAGWHDADLRLLIAEIDDANTHSRYMALAADDQLGLFEGVAV